MKRLYKVISIYIGVITLGCFAVDGQQKPVKLSIYDRLASEFSRSMVVADMTAKMSRCKTSEEQCAAFKTDEAGVSYEMEHRSLIYTLFANRDRTLHGQAEEFGVVPPYLQQVWKELRLFVGGFKAPHITLAAKLDRTESLAGTVVFERLLTKPSCLLEKLRANSAGVKSLVDNEKALQELHDLFKQMRLVEGGLLEFWATAFPKIEWMSRWLAFRNDNSTLGNIERARLWGEISAPFADYIGTIKDLDDLHDSLIIGGGGLVFIATSCIPNRHMQIWPDRVLCAGLGVGELLLAWFLTKTFVESVTSARDMLVKVAELSKIAARVQLLVEDLPVLEAICAQSEQLSALADGKDDAVLAALIESLATNTFAKGMTFPVWSARVKRVSIQLYELRERFVGALEALGEVDAWHGVAMLYREHNANVNRFSLPEYGSFSVPSLTIAGVWDPYISSDKAIANDVVLGGFNRARHMIITGPNAGGKSTYMRAIMATAYLGQTIGIVPAVQAQLSPFEYIGIIANVGDDPAAAKSLFRAEVDQVRDMIDQVEKLGKGGYALVMADELYRGTSPMYSADIALATAEYVATVTNGVWLIATHCNELATAEQTTNGLFCNRHVDLKRSPDGSFDRFTFKILPGATTESTAFDILLQRNFDVAVVQRARAIRMGIA